MEYSASLLPLMPEIFLLGAACAILVIDLFLSRETRVYTLGLSLAALVGTVVMIYATAGSDQVLFNGAFVRDAMGDAFKAAMLAVTFFAFIYARHYLVQRGAFRGEYFVLALLGLLGMMIMVSAGGFLSIYLGLELLALTLYALVAFDRGNPQGTEAAMKYFVLGAIASGLLLYGISMIYGATGYFSFAGIAEAVASGQADQKVLVFGLVFVVIGVAFKFGAVPFHMWAPDVYEGAPMPVVAFLGSAPKIAALAMAIRILHDGLGGLGAGWQGWEGMLVILAVLSLLLGNLVALVQTSVKRLLAYSTIAHVGFILLGILAGEGAGYTAAMFYAVTYALTAVGAFGLLTVLSGKGMEARELHDLKGLNQRNPWLAGLMLMFMLSMAGVPGFVGFFAKLYVIQALLDAGQLGLAVFAVVMSVVGAYYYLKVLKHVYFDKPITQAPIQGGMDAQLAVSVNGLALIYYGWLPGALLAFCQAAMGLKT